MGLLERITGGYSSTAKVVDGTLILSMPDAITPSVWRMDLGHAKASAIEVREEDAVYMLVLKTPKGDVNDIAGFATKGKSINALMAVTNAMKNISVTSATTSSLAALSSGDSRIVPTQEAVPVSKQPSIGQIFAATFGVILLLILLFVLLNISSKSSNLSGQTSNAQRGQITDAAGPNTSVGEAMSLDQFLSTQ